MAARAKKSHFPFSWLRYLRRGRAMVPVVRLAGVIGVGASLRPGLTLAAIDDTLVRAFRMGGDAVALVVNSPGGSPVQSALIHDRIRQLAKKHETKVITFCEDVAASGGYWLALAGDEIHADRSSIVGSIGVVAAGFGFVKTLAKLGVERRVYTAGEAKLILDPFQPEKKADVARLKVLQAEIHEAFKTHVRARRGERLKGTDEELFSGAFWTAGKARELGLIDGIGHLHQVLAEKYGEDVVIRPVRAAAGLSLRRLLFPRAGPDIEISLDGLADELLAAAERRALWQRFGL